MSFDVDLIVCDVDGTLLDRCEQKPSDEVMHMIERVLSERKIFSLASGRSYNALHNLFKNDNIHYICSDGAYIVKNNKVLHQNAMECQVLKTVVSKLGNSNFVLYGKEFAYASNSYTANMILNSEAEKVKPISLFENENIFKLAVFESQSYATHYVEVNKLFRKCYRDSRLIEYVSNNADKGTAIRKLQEIYNISYQSTAAFGDNTNDIQMLKRAYYSYSVDNAKTEIRSLARFHTASPVEEIIYKLL